MKILYRSLFVILISMFLFGCGDKTAGVEGKIVDGKGKPVPGVSLIFKQVQPTQGYEQFETKTGADGVFKLSGLAPVSDYTLAILSDKWRSKVTRKIKTLEEGQSLVLSEPIKVRFQQLKDGTVIDTKTDLLWYIHPVSDITAVNVITTVKSLNIGGYSDWRLPSREELNGLQEEKAPPKTPAAQPVLINKTCCAWVIEPNAQEVDWKFYIEEDNELWSSSKDAPDNRIVIVRSTVAVPATAAVQSPAAAETASPSSVETPAEKGEPSPGKLPEGVKFASRKACAEKRALAAKQVKAASAAAPADAKALPAPPAVRKEAAAPVASAARMPEPARAAASARNAEASGAGLSESLYFEAGGASLNALQRAKLSRFFSQIKGKKGVLMVDGHSDTSAGSKSANLLLSIERSSKVVAALNKMGLGNDIKVEVKALGDTQPVASNDTTEGRSLNRRVDLRFASE
ncbi:MAG: OmpA family protein [Smithellaceae bacterium]|nr:OmpA family protein [Syntrophaceae bacterium]MDD4240116.1 OmpA family protein [Smithellaceae bacterium]NLX51880.1 OmpA family protein [Deltaproteobacteria bacterium]